MIKNITFSTLFLFIFTHFLTAQQWNFNTDGNTEGWLANTLADNLVVEDGMLIVTSTHNDGPKIRTSGLNFLAINYPLLKIRIKNDEIIDGEEVMLRMFWNELSLDRSLFFPYTANADEFVTLEIDLSQTPGWAGLINAIRLDLCFAGGNEVRVDYISFEQAENTFELLTSYLIQSKANNRVLEVQQGSFENNSSVVLSATDRTLKQQWFLTADDNSNNFFLKNIIASKVLNIHNGGMVVSRIEESPTWHIIRKDNGYNWLKNMENQLYLAVSENELILVEEQEGDHLLWKIEQTDPDYPVPAPIPVNTGEYLVGAQSCNLWNAERNPWEAMKPFPKRRPVLDWYNEGTPIVTDWEIKMLVDHGINFVMPCWYRAAGNEGQPVEARLEHWLMGLNEARYQNYLKFMLMWENANLISSGVADADDLLNNVMPYLIENYFSRDNYLKIDGKPILAIYGPSLLINELGGETAALEAFEQVNEMMIEEGFAGIILWGQFCWGSSHTTNSQMFNTGMTHTFPYHLPTFMNVLPGGQFPTEQQIINGHLAAWNNQYNASLVPNIINVSMGWDSSPWGNFVSNRKWRLHPHAFGQLAQMGKDLMDQRPEGSLDSRIMMLDNWNEFGEGHYIMPTEQYGFGYLQAIKNVFDQDAPTHINRIEKEVQNFKIYPNPASQKITLSGSFQGTTRVEIYSLNGTLETTQKIEGDTLIVLDVSFLNPGFYLVRAGNQVQRLIIY